MVFIWGQFHRKCSRYVNLIWVWKLLIKITATSLREPWVSSLASGKMWLPVWYKSMRHIHQQDIIPCGNSIIWMLQDLAGGKSILVQGRAWCHQATSHYMKQCWLQSLMPHGIIRPKWVKKNGPLYIKLCCLNHEKIYIFSAIWWNIWNSSFFRDQLLTVFLPAILWYLHSLLQYHRRPVSLLSCDAWPPASL